MALEIEQDQDQVQPERRIPTPDEVFGTKKRIPTPDEVLGVKKKSSLGYSVTPLPSQDKFDIGEEVATIGMEVYPNPASGSVNVKFEASSADYTVAITDLSGRQVASKVITNANGSQTVEMPIEGLATGNYLVTVSSNGASFTQNLMVK